MCRIGGSANGNVAAAADDGDDDEQGCSLLSPYSAHCASLPLLSNSTSKAKVEANAEAEANTKASLAAASAGAAPIGCRMRALVCLLEAAAAAALAINPIRRRMSDDDDDARSCTRFMCTVRSGTQARSCGPHNFYTSAPLLRPTNILRSPLAFKRASIFRSLVTNINSSGVFYKLHLNLFYFTLGSHPFKALEERIASSYRLLGPLKGSPRQSAARRYALISLEVEL